MTTIIIHQPTKSVYIDRCSTLKGGHFAQRAVNTDKIYCFEGGVIVGAGLKDDIQAFANSYIKSKEFKNPSKNLGNSPSRVYIVTLKGESLQIIEYASDQGFIFPKWGLVNQYILKNGAAVAGSGGKYALGALRAGAKPEEAIHIAGQLDTYTSCDCNIFDLQEGKLYYWRKGKAHIRVKS